MIEIKTPGYFWLDTWVLANVIQLATQDFRITGTVLLIHNCGGNV